MFTHHKEEKSYKINVCIIGTILAIIITGILIYVCLYLTEYKVHTATLHSIVNGTNHTSKSITFATIAINKQTAIALTTAQPTNSVITLKKEPLPSFTRVILPSLTQVAVPPKPLRKVTYVPETVQLTDVTPTT